MPDSRAIIESSDADGVLALIELLEDEYHHVSYTIPMQTKDGRYISSVIYSNDTTIMEIKR